MKAKPHPLPEGPPPGPRLITGNIPTTAAQTTEVSPFPQPRGKGFWFFFTKTLAALSIGLVVGGAISLALLALS